jgi:hypothetical protein
MARFTRSGRGLLVAAVLAAATLLPAAASAQTLTSQWGAALSGANEVPANTSAARGTFTATIDEAANTIQWSLSVPAITNATAAHLHTGQAGTNGPIALNLFAAPAGSPAQAVNVSGSSKGSDLVGPLQGNFQEFIRAVKGGTIYVNVHTTGNPGGEIRAQVVTASAVTAASPAAPKTGNAGLVGGASSGTLAGVLAVLAVGVVAGGRALAARRA